MWTPLLLLCLHSAAPNLDRCYTSKDKRAQFAQESERAARSIMLTHRLQGGLSRAAKHAHVHISGGCKPSQQKNFQPKLHLRTGCTFTVECPAHYVWVWPAAKT